VSTAPRDTGALPEWSELLRVAVARLAEAGVEAPRADAEALLAPVMEADRGVALARVFAGARPSEDQARRFELAVARRVRRDPLQHITGVAHFHGVDLAVGPGVFVPRPETELLAAEGVRALRALDRPARAVDLCTGSGALAAALAAWARAHGRDVAVTAVELDDAAHAWARRNLEPWGVDLRHEDALLAGEDLAGVVDVVLSNPPYVPEAELAVQPEALADPPRALYGGDDRGLRLPLGIAGRAAVLLRPGGVFAMEHHETQGAALTAALLDSGAFSDVRVHQDLTGRDRWIGAVRTDRPAAGGASRGPSRGTVVEEWAP